MMSRAQVRSVVREPTGRMRAFWSAMDAAATPASTLATMAVLVRVLGASDYGILVIALAVSGLSLAVNPAIAITTTKFVSQLSGQGQVGNRSIAGVISVSLITVALIDLVLLLGTAIFGKPLSLWMYGAAVIRAQRMDQILLLAMLALGIQQIETVLAAAIRGLECFRQQALLEVFSRTVLTAAVILVAWRTRSLKAILIVQCAVYLLSMLVRVVALRLLLPNKRLFEVPRRHEARTLFKFGGWMWLTALAGVAYTSADRIIVGRSLGAAAAGEYYIYVQITQLIHFIPISLFAFSFPAFSRLAAQGHSQHGGIAKAYQTYLFGIGATALGISGAMVLFWKFLLRVFSGDAAGGDQSGLSLLLGANFLLLAASAIPYYLLLAFGRSKTVSLVTSISMLTALALMVVLVPRYGLLGAALARLAYGIGALTLLQKANIALKRHD